MEVLNRIALIVTPRRRLAEWVTRLPGERGQLRTDELASHRCVYLMTAGGERELQDLIDEWAPELFEELLANWTQDESLWPRNRTPHTFRDWFQVELIDVVIDADPLEPVTAIEATLQSCTICQTPLDPPPLFVTQSHDGIRRWVRDEFEEYLMNAPDERQLLAVIPCCSPACAEEAEAELRDADASEPSGHDFT